MPKFISIIPTADPVTHEDAYIALTETGAVYFAKWQTFGAPDEFHLSWINISENIDSDSRINCACGKFHRPGSTEYSEHNK